MLTLRSVPSWNICIHGKEQGWMDPDLAPGDTLGISGWGCAAGTMEPLTYARATSAEFCYPILE